jgi:hypothetical protein
MSSAFRDYNTRAFNPASGFIEMRFDIARKTATEQARRAEFLKFEHDPSRVTDKRYYNRITREKVGGAGGNQTLLYWEAALAPLVGGRRKRKTRRRSFKI